MRTSSRKTVQLQNPSVAARFAVVVYGFGVSPLTPQLVFTRAGGHADKRPQDGNRATRKELDRQHTAKASPDAKTVKLADLISNGKSIIKDDPNFAKVFMKEKAALLEVLTEGDAILFKEASDMVASYFNNRS